MTKKIHLVGDDLYKKRYKSFLIRLKESSMKRKGHL